MVLDKYGLVASVVMDFGSKSLLDVGCRDGVLSRALVERGASGVAYTGLDMNAGPAVGIVADVSKGLPCEDGSYDSVVALDLLEHLDDMQAALDDFVRVSRGHVVIVLPNMAHVIHRVRFFKTGRIGGKYDIRLDAGSDRHRWLTVVPQIDTFMEGYAARYGMTIVRRDIGAGRRAHPIESLMKKAGFGRSWTAFAVMYSLRTVAVAGVADRGPEQSVGAV